MAKKKQIVEVPIPERTQRNSIILHRQTPAEPLNRVQHNLRKVDSFQIPCQIIYRMVFPSRCTFDYYYGVALTERDIEW
jgi:hypothetical protein